MTKIQITQQGYDQLQTELNELLAKKDRLITQIEEVAMPDESGEDGLAVQLKEELEVVNERIDELNDGLENAQIVTSKPSKSEVSVGSKVKIKIAGKVEKEFHIVSQFEADPETSKISNESPLGQALVGKKVGEEILVDAPVGKLIYKIVSIS